MEITIKEKETKPLLGREEIKAITKEKTPKKEEAKDAIASQLNKSKELIVVKNIYSKFGEQEKEIIAYIYDDIKTLKKFEKIEEPKKEEGKEEQKGEQREEKPEQEVKQKSEETKQEEKTDEKKEE